MTGNSKTRKRPWNNTKYRNKLRIKKKSTIIAAVKDEKRWKK